MIERWIVIVYNTHGAASVVGPFSKGGAKRFTERYSAKHRAEGVHFLMTELVSPRSAGPLLDDDNSYDGLLYTLGFRLKVTPESETASQGETE